MADKDFKVKAGLDLGTPLPLTEGGTGQTSATNALNAILPVQTSAANKFLQSDGTSTSWVAAAVVNNATFTGSSIVIPSGTTAERPVSPVAGAIRVNTTSGTLEFYTGTLWGSIATFPQPPTSLVATNVGTGRAYGNGAASISFTTASADGGSTITSYRFKSNPGNITTSTGTTSPQLATGLSGGTSYSFTGYAVNSIGDSAESSSTSSIAITTLPQAPTIGTVSTVNSTTVSIPFTAGGTGGSTITAYTVTSSPSISLSTSSLTSPLSVTGSFIAGTAYTFTIAAVNANGTSIASSASNSIAPFNPPTSVTYLVVGGGGGGTAGGGGAGGFKTSTLSVSSGSALTVTVGGGGGGDASNGGDSTFHNVTVLGGGRGGFGGQATPNGYGSGGGGGYGSGGDGVSAGGTGAATNAGGNGYGGGSGINGNNTGNNKLRGGGGGGASGNGNSYSGTGTPGNGGNGTASSISGVSVTYAGGGGGSGETNGSNISSGGSGGGGNGGRGNTTSANIGTDGLGGGGGGGLYGAGGQRGGSGVVIISYPTSYALASSATGSTYSTAGGNHIYTWTGSGTVTF